MGEDGEGVGLWYLAVSRAMATLTRLGQCRWQEMASDELKKLRNAMTQEAIREHQMAKTGGTVTDLFQCGKCKKKNCTYNQVRPGCQGTLVWGTPEGSPLTQCCSTPGTDAQR